MDACVIGYGVIGKATAKAFGIKDYYDLKGSTITLKQAATKKYIFICLPTPVKEGEYDVYGIDDTIVQLKGLGFKGIIIIRSTVRPGFSRARSEGLYKRIVSNPEFLTEKTADDDMVNPDFVVIGSDIESDANEVKRLYKKTAIKPIHGFIMCSWTTAEMIKVTGNAFYTTKVIFANEVFDICDRYGIDYEKVKWALEHLKFGSKNHFTIFHKGGRGAKGKCLGKDMEAFAYFAESRLFNSVQAINAGFPNK